MLAELDLVSLTYKRSDPGSKDLSICTERECLETYRETLRKFKFTLKVYFELSQIIYIEFCNISVSCAQETTDIVWRNTIHSQYSHKLRTTFLPTIPHHFFPETSQKATLLYHNLHFPTIYTSKIL